MHTSSENSIPCSSSAPPASPDEPPDPFSEAREYLARIVPWPQEGEPPAYVNIHWTIPAKNPDHKPYWTGRAVRDLDEAAQTLKWAIGLPDTRDIYVCMSSQRTAQEKVSKAGNKYLAPIRNQENAAALKSLFIDLDAKGGDNSYANLDEAVRALADFLRVSSLPRHSLVVASGRGIHVYWVLSRALTVAEWQPLAHALVKAAKQHGLKCDYGVTTDAARVLRVPQTNNYKTGTPRRVRLAGTRLDFDYSLERIQRALLPYAVPVPTTKSGFVLDPALFPPRQPLPGESDLAAGIDNTMPEAEVRACLDAIPNTKTDWIFWNTMGMRIFAATGGADYGLEEWQAWSAKNPQAGSADTCEDRWATYSTSPPTKTGAGALVNEARSALNDPSWMPCPPPSQVTSQVTTSQHPNGFGATVSPNLTVSFSNIRHRRWLYGIDLVRGEITLLAAPGGIGKSSFALGIAAALATGQELLEEKVFGKDLKALYVNAEDSALEMRRRIWAFAIQHGLAEQDLSRFLLLGADDWQVQRLSLLRIEKGNSVLDEPGIEHLKVLIDEHRPDLVVLDPLLALCGGGNLNDNAAMALVMRALKRLAIKFDCAILILHHTRKGGDLSNAEAIGGASAIVNLARRAIMAVPMTTEEATNLRILPSQRSAYFKAVASKSNLAPRTDDTPFYELRNVALPNAEPPTYMSGDNVQAIVRAKMPSTNIRPTADDLKIRRAILDVVDRGKMVAGQVAPYSPNLTGANNQRALVGDALDAVKAATAPQQWQDADLHAVVKRNLDALTAEGWLVDEEIKSGRFRRRRALKVDWSSTPWHAEHESSPDGAPEQSDPDAMAGIGHESAGEVVNGQ